WCAVCQLIGQLVFFFSSRRRHTRSKRDWSSDVCSSDLRGPEDADEISPRITVALEELGAERTRMVFTLERRVPAEAGEDEDVRDGWRSALDEVLVPLLGELAPREPLV